LCIQSWAADPRAAVLWAHTIKEAEADAGRREGNSVGARWLHAIEEWSHGRDQAAVELFTGTLSNAGLSDRGRAIALVARSDLFYQQSRLDAALDDINEAIGLLPQNPRLRHERAWIHWRAERIDDALEDAQDAVEMLDPDDTRNTKYRLLQACVLGDKEGPNRALTALEQITGLEEHPGGLLTHGRMLRKLGKQDAAIRSFKEVVSLDRGLVREAWIEVGTTYEEKGKTPGARQAYRKAIEADAETEHAWRGLGRCLDQMKSKEDAQKELRELDVELEDKEICAFRGVALMEIECLEAAQEELWRAVNADPSRPEFRLWLVEAQIQDKRWGDAARQVSKALQLRPKWPIALVLRGLYRSHVNDHAGALADWTEAEEIDPTEAKMIDPNEHGLALSVVGKYQAALAAFDRVDPDERGTTITYNRAIAFAMDVGVSSASEELVTALKKVEEEEDQLISIYGEAGLACITGEAQRALVKLEEAMELDRTQTRKWAETDPAWINLREDPNFKRLLRSHGS
jgi:tetratricopeptide (TPR) repeat protein